MTKDIQGRVRDTRWQFRRKTKSKERERKEEGNGNRDDGEREERRVGRRKRIRVEP